MKNILAHTLEILIITLWVLLFPSMSKAATVDNWSDMDAEDEDLLTSVINEEDVMGIVELAGKVIEGDILRLTINAREVKEEVLGIAFELKYDSDKASFLKYVPGSFLEAGGDPIYLVEEKNKGLITFGETLRRDDVFIDGGGKIVDFYFQLIGDRDGEVNFIFNRGVLSTLRIIRQDLQNVVWKNFILDRKMLNRKGEVLTQSLDGLDMQSNVKYAFFRSYSLLILGMVSAGVAALLTIRLLKKRSAESVNFK